VITAESVIRGAEINAEGQEFRLHLLHASAVPFVALFDHCVTIRRVLSFRFPCEFNAPIPLVNDGIGRISSRFRGPHSSCLLSGSCHSLVNVSLTIRLRKICQL
jgi:hypothetical protein